MSSLHAQCIRIHRDGSSVDALLRLHKKTKVTDVYLDHATEPSAVRQVWSEIRDGLERGGLINDDACLPLFNIYMLGKEAQCRMAFVSALTVDVINPIISLKVSIFLHALYSLP